MIERKIMIHTDKGAMEVLGYANNWESLIGVHHNPDQPAHLPYWRITFLPVGTLINSIFPRPLLGKTRLKALLKCIDELETAEQAAWLVLSTLPWGTHHIPPEYADIAARIRAMANPA